MAKEKLPAISNPNLFQLTREAQTIVLALIESGGELTPEIESRIEANETALMRKVDGYVYYDDHFDAQIDLLKRKEEGLRSIRKGIENAKERLRENIKAAMLAMKTDVLTGDEYRFKISKRAPKLVIDNEAAIPQDYKIIVQSTTVDKETLGAALRDGFTVPGARLEEVKALLTQPNTGKD